MPLNYARKKTYRRRRRITGIRPKTKKVIKRIVRKAIASNLEVKRYMSSGVERKVNTVTQGQDWLQPFVNVTQGTASFQRVGNRIKVIGCQIKNFFYNNSALSLYARFCVLRVLDKSVLSNTSTIFLNTNNQASSFASITGMASMMRPFAPSRVSVLYDKVFKISGNVSTDESAGAYTKFTKFIKFPKGMYINYNEANSGAAEVDKQIMVGVWVAQADEDPGLGVDVEWSWQFNTFFTDA